MQACAPILAHVPVLCASVRFHFLRMRRRAGCVASSLLKCIFLSIALVAPYVAYIGYNALQLFNPALAMYVSAGIGVVFLIFSLYLGCAQFIGFLKWCCCDCLFWGWCWNNLVYIFCCRWLCDLCSCISFYVMFILFDVLALIGTLYFGLAAAIPLFLALLSLYAIAAVAHSLARFAHKATDGKYGRNDTLEEFVQACITAGSGKMTEMPDPRARTVTTPTFALVLGSVLVVSVMICNWLTDKLVTFYVYKLDTQDIPWWNIVQGFYAYSESTKYDIYDADGDGDADVPWYLVWNMYGSATDIIVETFTAIFITMPKSIGHFLSLDSAQAS